MRIKDRAKPKTPPVKPGVYIGICVGIIDLGEQYSEKFKNYSNKIKIILSWPVKPWRWTGNKSPGSYPRNLRYLPIKKQFAAIYILLEHEGIHR